MNGGHAVYVLDTDYQGDNIEDNPHYDSFVGSVQITEFFKKKAGYWSYSVGWCLVFKPRTRLVV